MNRFCKLLQGIWQKKKGEPAIRELQFLYNVMPDRLKNNERVALSFVTILEELIRKDELREQRKNAKYMYSEFCTAFYAKGELIFWDEIEDKQLKVLKIRTKGEAKKIMDEWVKNAPKGIVCEILN